MYFILGYFTNQDAAFYIRARNWVGNQKSILRDKLKSTGGTSNESLEKMIAVLESTCIASVALDASSVFHHCEDYHTIDTSCSRTGNNSKNLQRKSIKEKAVDAMLEDGVDISAYVPNTVEEIISCLPLLSSHLQDDRHLKPKEFTPPVPESTSQGIGMLDKLIVLCSCGDEMKYKLARRSKSVEEWSIDAPTKAATAGEGDTAYLRVSKEIRDEVNILMASLVGDAEIATF